jgi:hypothetical protein
MSLDRGPSFSLVRSYSGVYRIRVIMIVSMASHQQRHQEHRSRM